MILCAFLDVDHLSHSALTRPAADLSRGERGRKCRIDGACVPRLGSFVCT